MCQLQDLFHHERFRWRRCVSDGKYNITNDFGGTLHEHIGRQQALDLMKYVDTINMTHGGEGARLFSTAQTKYKKFVCRTVSNCWTRQCAIWGRISTMWF